MERVQFYAEIRELNPRNIAYTCDFLDTRSRHTYIYQLNKAVPGIMTDYNTCARNVSVKAIHGRMNTEKI